MKILIVSLGRKHVWSLFGSEMTEALNRFHKDLFFIGSKDADNIPDVQNRLLLSTGKTGTSNILQTLNIFNYMKIISFIKKVNPGVIIYPVRHRWLYIISCYVAKKNIKQIFTIHDAVKHPGDESGIDDYIDKKIIENVNVMLTLSKHVEKLLIDKGVNKKTFALFHPYYEKFDKICSKRNLNLPYEKYVLIFGRIKKYKGIEKFIALWDKYNIKTQFIILGEGENFTFQSSNIIRINKEASDEELKAYIQDAEFVIASHMEASQSGVVAVSLGLGTPVLASNVGGIPEQFEDGQHGLLFDIDSNESELLDKLTLMETKLSYFKSHLGSWKESFSFDTFAKKLLKYLKDM